MDLKEAKEITNTFINNVGIEVKTFELKEATKTILQELDNLQKENEELQKENGKLTRARKWFIEHTVGEIATPEMLRKILANEYIHKDRIREKIEDLEEMLKKTIEGEIQRYTPGDIRLFISCLQELLKEE